MCYVRFMNGIDVIESYYFVNPFKKAPRLKTDHS